MILNYWIQKCRLISLIIFKNIFVEFLSAATYFFLTKLMLLGKIIADIKSNKLIL